MDRKRRDPAQQINPRSVDPETGELVDAEELEGAEKGAARKGSGILDALKQKARDAAMRRVSTKR
jgi:hypothetical protein